jgi:two-component system response regulator RstA
VANLLLVEDDLELAELTRDFLHANGHQVDTDDGRMAVEKILAGSPDLVILDVELPRQTGFSICKLARQQGYTGAVIFLTARRSATDELLAFELGGDDFVRKPVDPRILVLRIEAATRNRQQPTVWAGGGLEIDARQRQVQSNGEPISLTTGQFDLLWLLARNAGDVVSRETYYREIRGIRYDGVDRGYDSRIRELRARLDAVGVEGRIVTVRGSGYQLTVG